MDQSTKTSERITAIISTVVAVAILAVGVTAQQTRSTRGDELAYLESDLRFQLQSAFRLNPKEGQQRLQQVNEVLAVWQESQKTADDRRLLADWLLEATIRSMPGSMEPLPPAPPFGGTKSAVKPTSPSSATGFPTEPVEADGYEPDILDPTLQPTTTETSAPPTHERRSILKQPVALTPKVTKQIPVRVNLSELTARIAGYHVGLDEVEAAEWEEDRPQVDHLAQQVELLRGLTKDYQFVKLYYESLTAEERRSVHSPRAMQPTLVAVRQYLQRLEDEVEADFLGEFDADSRERLAALRQQLAEIADQIAW